MHITRGTGPHRFVPQGLHLSRPGEPHVLLGQVEDHLLGQWKASPGYRYHRNVMPIQPFDPLSAPGALNLDATGCRGLFGAMSTCTHVVEFTTNNVTSANPSFICWKFTMLRKYVSTFPNFPEADRQAFELAGVSMQWWNDEGMIWKMTDYGSMSMVDADGKEQRI